MTASRSLLIAAIVSALGAVTDRGDAQLLDRLKKKVTETKNAVSDARSIRCDVQGVCGTVRQSDLFEPSSYESIAVTVFDGTGRFREAGTQGMVRDAFESRLVQNGYLLAASSDAEQVRTQMARGDAWTDEELAQMKDFVKGIDAVVVVDMRRVDAGRCAVDGRPDAGLQATVHLSARWLHVDAGDVPWVATHKATICQEGTLGEAQATALETVAAQLATSLPVRKASPSGRRSITSGPETP
jgi:hypothetical protein